VQFDAVITAVAYEIILRQHWMLLVYLSCWYQA